MPEQSIHKRDIIVIGGSAGSLSPLRSLVSHLPHDFPGSIFVVVHVPNDAPSLLPQLLAKAGPLPARRPANMEKIEKGVIYVAPPDFHMLIKNSHIEISRGPRENRHRPAIDPLFRSAARAYGSRVAGVILSGQLDDGASGLVAIKMRNGLAITQDPLEAQYSDMPTRAAELAGADRVLRVEEIAALLVKLAREPANARGHTQSARNGENRSAAGKQPAENVMSNKLNRGKEDKADLKTDANREKEGKSSAFACPECHGVLWEVEEGALLRFRCRVGHAYTATTLRSALSDATEDALWAAMRSLQEKAALLRRVVGRSSAASAARFEEQAQGNEKHAEAIRAILLESQDLEGGPEEQNETVKENAKSAAKIKKR